MDGGLLRDTTSIRELSKESICLTPLPYIPSGYFYKVFQPKISLLSNGTPVN